MKRRRSIRSFFKLIFEGEERPKDSKAGFKDRGA